MHLYRQVLVGLADTLRERGDLAGAQAALQANRHAGTQNVNSCERSRVVVVVVVVVIVVVTTPHDK